MVRQFRRNTLYIVIVCFMPLFAGDYIGPTVRQELDK